MPMNKFQHDVLDENHAAVTISLLTPTYNRSYTLMRLYESICLQPQAGLEWVIVNDGSSDDTEDLVARLITENKIAIRYHWQPNAGKHVALNTGAAQAAGQYVFIVDSDDALDKDAISTIRAQIHLFPNFVGYCFRRKTFAGRPVGRIIAKSHLVMTPTQAGNLLQGDLAYVFLKSVLVDHPFPVFGSEKFVPELYIWNKISDAGEIVFFPGLYVYFCDYLMDGYTNNFKKNLKENPSGFGVYYRNQIVRETLLVRKIKCLVRYLQCLFYRCLPH